MKRSHLFAATGLLFACAWALVLARPIKSYYLIELRNAELLDRLLPFYPLLFLPLFVHRLRLGDSVRLLVPAAVFGALVCLLGAYTGVQALIWLGGIWGGLCALCAFGGRVSAGGLLLFLLIPPVTAKTTLVLGFRLRLFLTEMAAKVLALVDPGIQVLGNALVFQGRNFAVDPACEGLKMLTACALLVLVLVRDDDEGKSSEAGTLRKGMLLILITAATLSLWMFANLLRIITLVFANIGPESPRHGIVGLVIFCLVVVFPMVTARRLPAFLRSLREGETTPARQPPARRLRPAFQVYAVLLMSTLAALVLFMPRQAGTAFREWPVTVGGFTNFHPGMKIKNEQIPASEIAVYRSGGARLILKQGLNPLRVGHHPRRCWQGLGYKFTKENDVVIPGVGTVRMARLHMPSKDKPVEYRLAWWYQARSSAPVLSSETEWRRKRLLEGRRYTQVNVFAPADDANMEAMIRRVAAVRPLTGTAPVSVAGP